MPFNYAREDFNPSNEELRARPLINDEYYLQFFAPRYKLYSKMNISEQQNFRDLVAAIYKQWLNLDDHMLHNAQFLEEISNYIIGMAKIAFLSSVKEAIAEAFRAHDELGEQLKDTAGLIIIFSGYENQYKESLKLNQQIINELDNAQTRQEQKLRHP